MFDYARDFASVRRRHDKTRPLKTEAGFCRGGFENGITAFPREQMHESCLRSLPGFCEFFQYILSVQDVIILHTITLLLIPL